MHAFLQYELVAAISMHAYFHAFPRFSESAAIQRRARGRSSHCMHGIGLRGGTHTCWQVSAVLDCVRGTHTCWQVSAVLDWPFAFVHVLACLLK
jgi:hypothetical protein